MANELQVGQEIKIRADRLYSESGLPVVFMGQIVALTESTVDALVTFNGTTLMVSHIPLEKVATLDAGSYLDEILEN